MTPTASLRDRLAAVVGPEHARDDPGALETCARDATPLSPRGRINHVVALNPGRLRQLQGGLRRRRLHTRAIHLAQVLN